jgi:asparagine synthetase B (glutamine-hydrolysing)
VIARWRALLQAIVTGGTGLAPCAASQVLRSAAVHQPSATVLEALTRALAHRGPGWRGASCVRAMSRSRIARLAIIDLATGDQPLFAGRRRACRKW